MVCYKLGRPANRWFAAWQTLAVCKHVTHNGMWTCTLLRVTLYTRALVTRRLLRAALKPGQHYPVTSSVVHVSTPYRGASTRNDLSSQPCTYQTCHAGGAVLSLIVAGRLLLPLDQASRCVYRCYYCSLCVACGRSERWLIQAYKLQLLEHACLAAAQSLGLIRPRKPLAGLADYSTAYVPRARWGAPALVHYANQAWVPVHLMRSDRTMCLQVWPCSRPSAPQAEAYCTEGCRP